MVKGRALARLLAPIAVASMLAVGTETPTAAAPSPYPPCYGGIEITKAELCWLSGRNGSGPLVVVVGDSHAGHWWPALGQVGKMLGLRIAALAKSGCPVPVMASRTSAGATYRECGIWRASAFALLDRLRPQLVLAASSYQYRGLILHQGRIAPNDLIPGLWDQGLRESLQRLTGSGASVRLIRDLPRFREDLPECLARHRRKGRACGLPESRAIDGWSRRIHSVEAAAVSPPQVAMADMTSVICRLGFCSPVTPSGAPRYRDSNHLHVAFARTLWPRMARVVNRVIPTRPSAPVRVRARVTRWGARVSWSRPLVDGGAPLTTSHVRVTPTGRARAARAPRLCQTTTTSCRVRRLLRGVKYRVTVRVANRIGMSRVSAVHLTVRERRR